MTKQQREKEEQLQHAFDNGMAVGRAQGKVDTEAAYKKERQERVLEANLKLANALGQMVNAVSETIRAFVSDNNTLH